MGQPLVDKTYPYPPQPHTGMTMWLRDNLFGTWYNTLLTILASLLIVTALSRIAPWVLYGARWEVIPENVQLLLTGTYPRSEVWRLWTVVLTATLLLGLGVGVMQIRLRSTAIIVLIGALGVLVLPIAVAPKLWISGAGVLLLLSYLIGLRFRALKWWVVAALVIWPVFAFIMVRGLAPILTPVATGNWGGLMLTLILAAASILLSFPIGVVLALGRRSRLPIVSGVCTVYIEIIRGLPLIAILFMAQVMAPIFLPGITLDRVLRAMIGFTVFTSAYMAENVRGGLQSVGRGQYEAASAIGLTGPLTTLLIVLPQALRAVIPSTVGQFISLFKDTSLVAVVGLFDLMGIARSILANPKWLGLQAELFLFAALLYWVFSYTMSVASRRLERRLGVGER